MLQPLIPSIARDRTPRRSAPGLCAYCGIPASDWCENASCVPCHLVMHLDRPTIDTEAVLGWVPEISQAALNRIIRELHCQLHQTAGASATDPGPHYLSGALNGRVAAAAKVLGTSQPSELAQSLALLSPATYAERHRRLGGIRIMAAGHFFVDGVDVYPQVLAGWIRSSNAQGVQ